MNTAFLLLGGNLGNRTGNLAQAKEFISSECGRIHAVSSLYETAAWGNTEQPSFLNQALSLSTELSAKQLLRRLLKAEKKMGRIREEKYGPRIIDIDILFFNAEIHNSTILKLPHPEIQNRRFALLPLVEIAPDFIHPVLKKSITELLKECPDTLPVKKYS
ncbi:MAG: 2-amino-4-hydroxy-6-hydroxymethyldihydropteridine diphosphokinase [Chitinophagaceae bacterium]